MPADARRQLLVSELHPVNWWLFWALSFLVRVRTRVINASCSRWPRGRIEVIDPADYMTADTATHFKATALEQWQEWRRHVPDERWTLSFRNVPLDLAPKVNQLLSRHFERMQFLRFVLAAESGAGATLVDSAVAHMFARWEGQGGARNWSLLSLGNRWCDALWVRASAVAYGLRTLLRLVRGVARRRSTRPGALTLAHIPILYDCDNPNEYYVGRDKRSFAWLIDGDVVSKSDVLFLLTTSATRAFIKEAQAAGYAAGSLDVLYSHIDRPRLLRSAWATMVALVRVLLPWQSLESTLTIGQISKINEMVPIYERWQPQVYVESVSSLGVETPAIAYLQAHGVRCVLYHMSGGILFSSDTRLADFRAVFYSHLLAPEMIAWNSDQKAFYHDHPQGTLRTSVIGPLMPGDETVMQRSPRRVRERALKWQDDGHDYLHVVAFDVGTVGWDVRVGSNSHSEFFTYPDCFDAAGNQQFVADLARLLDAHPRLRLVFKPKRDPFSPRFFYSPEYKRVVSHIAEHPRGAVLAENLNPWVPIAVADLCVVLAFSSPGLAALHYGVPAVYHDPLDTVRAHRQPFLASLTTHSFTELDRQVTAALSRWEADRDLAATRRYVSGPGAAECLGNHPGTNSSDAFRRYLQGVGDSAAPSVQAAVPASAEAK